MPYKTLKTAKGRPISSTKWLERQINDPYITLAKQKGYRSRASFKILEIDEKFKIFKQGQRVLDLGSAPGGWSQVAVKKVGKGNVVAVDILQMEAIVGVEFICGDFLQIKPKGRFDVIMSDMAANTTGEKNTDHLRTIELAEIAFDFTLKSLQLGGTFITKVFQGQYEPQLFNRVKERFKVVCRFKPQSSRKESVEMYIVGREFNG